MAPGDESHVTVAEMRSLDDNATDWTREPDQTFYLAYDFNPVNNLHFHDPEHYPIFGGTERLL
jgi:L-ascorbate oxidase